MSDLASEIDIITKVLRDEWDPIGCGVPDDEYKSYALHVVELVRDAKRLGFLHSAKREQAVASVAAYLTWARCVRMSLDAVEGCPFDASAAIPCVDALWGRL